MAATLPGRVSIAATPTPIQPLPRLGAGLGLDLSVKRDDLTGFAESGNKAWGVVGALLLVVVYLHAVWLPKHGINGWTGEPRDKYLELVQSRIRR